MASAWGASWGDAWGDAWGAVGAVADTTDRTADAIFAKQKRRYYRQLQVELDYQLEAQEAQAKLAAMPNRRKRKKAAKKLKVGTKHRPVLAEPMPRMRAQVAEMLTAQPKTDTTQRLRYEGLLTELDRIAHGMAMQDEEEALFMLLIG